MRSEDLEILRTLQEMEKAGTLTGCFDDIPISVYHHPTCPGYSSTTIKRIVAQSYNHWFCAKDEAARALDFGSAFHCWRLEPQLFNEYFKVAPTENRRSEEWKIAKATADGRTVISVDDFDCIKIMSKKVFQHPEIGPFMERARYEQTFFSIDSATGLLKKCRTDIITPETIWDLKSTIDASEDAFAWDMKKRLQRISCAYYLEIVSEVEGRRRDDFRLIACEKQEPFEVSPRRVSEHSIAKGEEAVRIALGTIRRILDEGPSAWRGYQLGAGELYI